MIDVLGLGVSTVDELVIVAHHPRVNEKQKILSRSRQCGGLTGSALVAASRMGCRCAHLVALGTGELSAFLRAAMAAEGVELIEDASNPDADPYYAMILGDAASGGRSILWDNSRARAPALGDRERKMALAARCLFVDHIYAAAILPLVLDARAAGVDVVGDFERTTPASLELMAAANHVILPLAYAQAAAGEISSASSASFAFASAADLAEWFAAVPGRAIACVTDGENGAWWAAGSAPGCVAHQPAFPMDAVIDTTGCGDVFHGVYCDGLVRGLPAENRFLRASAAAALKTRVRGAQAGAPTAPEVEKFLKERLTRVAKNVD